MSCPVCAASGENLVHRRTVEREIDEELRGTLDAIEDEHRRAGLSPDEARRAAMIQFGRIESLKEHVQDVKAGAWLETWFQDVRNAVCVLLRSPVFAVFAIASLALGIGATGAIFSLFDAVVLRTLPVPEADRLAVAFPGCSRARPWPIALSSTSACARLTPGFNRPPIGHRLPAAAGADVLRRSPARRQEG